MSNWADGQLKLFLSHSAKHKATAEALAAQLEEQGISVFVAHKSIQVSSDWRLEIEKALNQADALTLLAHAEIKYSEWCQQEVGWALGKNTPVMCLVYDGALGGFLERNQHAAASDDVVNNCTTILTWIETTDPICWSLTDLRIQALASANSFREADEISKLIVRSNRIKREQIQQIKQAYTDNNQVHHSTKATEHIKSLLEEFDESLPRIVNH